MKRTTLVKALYCYGILNLCLLLAGCGGWVTEASNIIGLLVPAIQAVVAILAAFGLSAGLATTVMDQVKKWSAEAIVDLGTIKDLIQQYKDAEASAQKEIPTYVPDISNSPMITK